MTNYDCPLCGVELAMPTYFKACPRCSVGWSTALLEKHFDREAILAAAMVRKLTSKYDIPVVGCNDVERILNATD
jgi:Zn-finger nucleic acid-binding protein